LLKTAFHFASGDGSSFSLALKLHREGHHVTWHVKAKEGQQIGKGYLPWSERPQKNAVVIFDTTQRGVEGERYRQAGHAVIGGNHFDKPLEIDRAFGAEIMRKSGIKVPETYPFTDIKSAVSFLDTVEGAWFVKVSADVGECDTYDAADPEAMIRYLEWVETVGKVHPFELQRKAAGIEVSCNGWFDGVAFVPPFDITIEEKKLLSGDVGPRTGCESCVVWHASNLALANRTVKKIADTLRKEGYVGPIDLNSLIDNEGEPLGLEWSARLGFDATQAWMHLFQGDLGEQLDAFAHGDLPEWEPTDVSHLSGTLRVTIPPYPGEDKKGHAKAMGLPLDPRVMTDSVFDPTDVMKGEDGLPAAAGYCGIVGTVNFVGHHLQHVKDHMLATAKSLEIPQAQFRVDPLSRAERDMAALKKLGLLGR
jgi:phosphoribosylamine--glycine ligase